jgi:hypothetical protein
VTDCTCRNFRGEPDHAAEQVAANLTAGHDWLTAYRAVFAPYLLPGRVSVSERLRARLRRESGVAAANVVVAVGLVLWVGCLVVIVGGLYR